MKKFIRASIEEYYNIPNGLSYDEFIALRDEYDELSSQYELSDYSEENKKRAERIKELRDILGLNSTKSRSGRKNRIRYSNRGW